MKKLLLLISIGLFSCDSMKSDIEIVKAYPYEYNSIFNSCVKSFIGGYGKNAYDYNDQITSEAQESADKYCVEKSITALRKYLKNN
jgi:hypothetical protein